MSLEATSGQKVALMFFVTSTETRVFYSRQGVNTCSRVLVMKTKGDQYQRGHHTVTR